MPVQGLDPTAALAATLVAEHRACMLARDQRERDGDPAVLP